MLVRKPWNFVSDLSSAMIINCLAQAATIFSWVKQPLKKTNKNKNKIKSILQLLEPPSQRSVDLQQLFPKEKMQETNWVNSVS